MKRINTPYNRAFVTILGLMATIVAIFVFLLPPLPMNTFLYDNALRFSHSKPASPEVVLIIIDDKSLSEIGSWPWRRHWHAQLLSQLTHAKAVGFDITFLDESPFPEDNPVFEKAITQHGRVVMSNFFIDPTHSNTMVSNPYAPFNHASAARGFINVPIDNDGVVRHLHLQHAHTPYLHFSLAMLQVGKAHTTLDRTLQADLQKPMIPFIGKPKHYTMVSYTDVVHHRIDPSLFHNKYVLIGAWASGLGDKFPTPTATEGINMAGVEILANALQASLDNTWIQEANIWVTLVVSLLWVLGFCVLMRFLSPTSTLIITPLLSLLYFSIHFFILKYGNLWIRLDPSFFGGMIAFPMWNWRVQHLALRQIKKQVALLNADRSPFNLQPSPQVKNLSPHSIENYLLELRQTLERIRNLHRFIDDSFDNAPFIWLAFNPQGHLLLSSKVAKHYLIQHQLNDKITTSWSEILQKIVSDTQLLHGITKQIKQILNQPTKGTSHAQQLEFKDALGKDMLLNCNLTFTSQGEVSSLLLTLIDISEIREEERQRECTMNFLTHDMRAPQSAIQALLKLQNDPKTALPTKVLLQKLEQLSLNTLSLVDDFLYFTKAKNKHYQMVPLNLGDILQNVTDNFWSICQQRRVQLQLTLPETLCFVQANESLLTRVFNNLVDNALKYGRDDMQLNIKLQAEESYWRIDIQDQGVGIPSDYLNTIFELFTQVPKTQKRGGLGMGLSFVHMVITTHGGSIRVQSQENQGTCFTVRLPMLSNEDE